MKKRAFALLLALMAALLLFGCTQEPAPTEPSVQPTTEATEPPPSAQECYGQLIAALEQAPDVTLDISIEKVTTVPHQTFTQNIEKKLSFTGRGTADAMIYATETVPVWEPDIEGTVLAVQARYEELYAEGKLFVDLENRAGFSSEMTYEEAQAYFMPVIPVDTALYEEMNVIQASAVPTVTFSAPAAGEAWAVPADAELVEGGAEAHFQPDGTVDFVYAATYTYGPAKVQLTAMITARPQAEAITLPARPERYVSVTEPGALHMVLQAKDMSYQAESVSMTKVGSMFTQAGWASKNTAMELNRHSSDEDVVMKTKQSIYIMDYYHEESEHTEMEETYIDGRYVYTLNEGAPTTYTTLTTEDIEEYCRGQMLPLVPVAKYWQDVTAEDLGSLYYLEFTFNEDYGNACQNMVAQDYWGDAAYLNAYATAYTTDECTGYLSIDKYTGTVVASGYKYQGTHTIEGQPYAMTNQTDQSFTLPSFGAYKEITEELLPEAEPENKATPLFYHVTGKDGQEMWLLGTIHVGDERTAYLPQEIYDAFAASDALALECDTEAFDKKTEEDEDLQDQVSSLYYYDDGTTVADHVDEEVYTKALKYLKATGSYNMNADYMKAGIWAQSIDNFYLDQGHTLSREQGVEERLTKLAKEQEKEIREVESSLFQIKMLTGWSEALQALLLEEAVEYGGIDSITGTNELFDMWCQGDEATLREYLAEEVDTSEMTAEELAEYEAAKPLLEEYNKAMSYDRNEGMLKVAIEYLESGDVVFYAVGLAHLLDSHNGLVDTLRAAGYTVEPVTYAP